uniref:NADH dehydrogenase subunit 4 n=1 Tax=Gormaniella terricola TaxID=2904618 RepID=UPI0021CC8B98|nr:NADH dehydrogenase subunit 4 [Gormaniella terricola]UWV18311.1 NADH dehydrogenase subunit 4 [Gormaniella terricola]
MLLITLILTPLVGAILVWFTGPQNAFKYSLWTTLISFVLSLGLWFCFDASSAEMFQLGWGLVGLDGISLWMVLLTTLLFPICILCSPTSLCTVLLLLESMLLACWSVLDLLGFYVLFESTLIPMFLLICLGGSRDRKIRAAYQLVFYTLIGSLAWLPCVLLMYSEAGTTSIELLYAYNWSVDTQLFLWWGFFLALAVKIPVIPIHLWLPEAHVEAPTAGSVLLAGVVLKLGTYGFLRFCLPLLPDACLYYSPFVITLGLISLIYSSLTTLRQVDLKKVIAYSSIAHMNMANMAIFTLHDQSLLGSLFMMISHGVVSPALFLCVGVIYNRYHTKLFRYLSGGCATTMPIFSLFFFIFSLANMALPLSPNFISELSILCGIFSTHTIACLLATISMVLSAAYTLWAYARLVHGMPNGQTITHMTDVNRLEFWTLAPLLICTLWLGLKPSLVIDSMANSVMHLHHLMITKML